MTDDKPWPWELRRPDLLLHEVAEQHPFDRPRTLLVRVDGPYEQQRLGDCTVLWEEPAENEHQRTRSTEQALQRLGCSYGRTDRGQWPLAVPVVVRPGSAWFSWDESEALLGLRYGSNLCDVVQGDVLTVTARGWVSWPDGVCGTEPKATWSVDDVSRGPALLEPLTPLSEECLACFLRRVLATTGCDGRLTATGQWQSARRRRGSRTAGLTRFLERHGGLCDCEVLLNVYPSYEIGCSTSSGCSHSGRGW